MGHSEAVKLKLNSIMIKSQGDYQNILIKPVIFERTVYHPGTGVSILTLKLRILFFPGSTFRFSSGGISSLCITPRIGSPSQTAIII